MVHSIATNYRFKVIQASHTLKSPAFTMFHIMGFLQCVLSITCHSSYLIVSIFKDWRSMKPSSSKYPAEMFSTR